jgi:hypothetical protein
MVTEPGINVVSNKGTVWIGLSDTYTKPFNNAGEDLILIIWAPMLRGSTPTSPSSHLTSPPAHMNHERFVDVCQEVKLRVSFCEFARPGNGLEFVISRRLFLGRHTRPTRKAESGRRNGPLSEMEASHPSQLESSLMLSTLCQTRPSIRPRRATN